MCLFETYYIDLTLSVYTIKRHIESMLPSSKKTVKSCQGKAGMYFLIIMCQELETRNEIMYLNYMYDQRLSKYPACT